MKRLSLRPIQIMPLGFLGIILLGALLLTLPFATKGSGELHFFDALFTATSATCVTGLVVADTGTAFTLFGQIVILMMIQIGGLGFMTVTAMLLYMVGKKVSLYERMTIAENIGESRLSGLGQLTRHAVRVTWICEAVGALLLWTRFWPTYGPLRGLWYAIFHSVSAFCNAGFDLLGGYSSFTGYTADPVVNITLMLLIVIGGLGFAVVLDLARRSGDRTHKLGYQSRVVLVVTAALIVGGALLIGFIEWDNPATLGQLPTGEKLMASLFQSVTLRTAGFNTIDQAGQHEASKFVGILLMLIGGSPAGTAGGLKTTTIVTLFATVYAILRGKRDVDLMGRRLGMGTIRRALVVLILGFSLLFVLSIIASANEPHFDFVDILFEMTSAMCTVGLSVGVTAGAGTFTRVLLMVLMFIGRIGMITFALSLTSSPKTSVIRRPEQDLSIG